MNISLSMIIIAFVLLILACDDHDDDGPAGQH